MFLYTASAFVSILTGELLYFVIEPIHFFDVIYQSAVYRRIIVVFLWPKHKFQKDRSRNRGDDYRDNNGTKENRGHQSYSGSLTDVYKRQDTMCVEIETSI